MSRYNVYTVEIKTGLVSQIAGINLSESAMEKRTMTALMFCDRKNYFVGELPASETREVGDKFHA